MCGRYSLFEEQDNGEISRIIQEVSRRYPDREFRTGEIYPTNTAPVLISKHNSIAPDLAVWGFPKYQGKGVIINARAETAEEKKTFRDSLLFRRCAIPSTGFYEWDTNKRKYLFRLQDERVLYMAGIYREYDETQRYVILTTAANDSMKAVHARMPIILPPDKMRMWMSDTDASIQYLHCEMPNLLRIG